MRVTRVELRRVALPLVRPFRTAFGVETTRDVLLVRVEGDRGEAGWGECVAMTEPLYSSEYVDAAAAVITGHLLPRIWDVDLRAEDIATCLRPVKGHPMAKAAIEMAVLDAELRYAERSFAAELGAVRDCIDCGVSVGIAATLDGLLEEVDGYVAAGYRRVKLKIEPGWDVEPVGAVREKWPDLPLQVDANTAYDLDDSDQLRKLDAFDLLLIEQPFAEDDLLSHAELARRIATPVCLDESIISAHVAGAAIAMGACQVVNIKAGRVGGYLEAVRVHDVCQAAGVPVWCGGMLETGLGRAANVALAALPGFTLPGDTSASDRYFDRDLTAPFELVDGRLAVPTGAGLGVEPLPDVLDEFTTERAEYRPG